MPYITTIRTGKPSIIPEVRNIHNNFILATYFSQQAIDTDDGSAYYEVYDNFFAYGDNGLKSDFGGHDNKWHGNALNQRTGGGSCSFTPTTSTTHVPLAT